MKRLLTIIILAAASCAGVFAQVDPAYGDRMEYSHGELYLNGVKLSPYEVSQVIGSEIYNETYVGASKQRRIGMTLIKVGAPVTGAGLVMIVTGSIYLGTSRNINTYTDVQGVNHVSASVNSAGVTAGTVLFALGTIGVVAGGIALEVGIPFAAIGSGRMRWIAEDFNQKSAPRMQFGLQPHGVGLSLNF
ncbi:MAG: hypothetical protein IJ795_04550 [Bacteroidales bacterium]|nr:hypothetical protein [Bacteroidales bacterium]